MFTGTKLAASDLGAGEDPESEGESCGFICATMSAAVYDDGTWIPELKGWMPLLFSTGKFVGMLFRHHSIAEALVGEVFLSEEVWGDGALVSQVQEYTV